MTNITETQTALRRNAADDTVNQMSLLCFNFSSIAFAISYDKLLLGRRNSNGPCYPWQFLPIIITENLKKNSFLSVSVFLDSFSPSIAFTITLPSVHSSQSSSVQLSHTQIHALKSKMHSFWCWKFIVVQHINFFRLKMDAVGFRFFESAWELGTAFITLPSVHSPALFSYVTHKPTHLKVKCRVFCAEKSLSYNTSFFFIYENGSCGTPFFGSAWELGWYV